MQNSLSIKMIAMDLDRTTLNAQSRLSDGNKAALLYAMSRGISVVVASGRSFSSLPSDILALPGIEYAVTANGAAVYSLTERKCIHRFLMTPESVVSVAEIAAQHPYARLEAFINGQGYASADYVQNPTAFLVPAAAVPYIQSTRIPVEDMYSFLRSHSGETDSIDIVVPGQPERDPLIRLVRETLPSVYVTSSASQLVEISHKDAGKHSGVRFVAELLGISSTEVVAFGDGDNDVDLLRWAGTGVAMGNATTSCKAAADLITLHHDADGLAHTIYDLLPI